MATRHLPSPRPSDVTRLANRAAALAFASAFAVVIGLMALRGAVQGAHPAHRAAAAAALVIAVAVTGWAWRARAQLREARAREENTLESAKAAAGTLEAPADRSEHRAATVRPRRPSPGTRSRPRPA
jgi:hypothetical protein